MSAARDPIEWEELLDVRPSSPACTTRAAAGRFFPQAYAVMSYPLEKQLGYARIVIEPIEAGPYELGDPWFARCSTPHH